MSYTQEQIDRANQVNLEQFLRSQGEKLIKSGHEYRWERYDSLTVKGNKWFRYSQNKGGYPVDFVMEFFDKTFSEAVQMLIGEEAVELGAEPAPKKEFKLPPRSESNAKIMKYLTEERKLPQELIEQFIAEGLIYEDAKHHNVVFVGTDANDIPCYAHCRGTADKFRMDVTGRLNLMDFVTGEKEQNCMYLKHRLIYCLILLYFRQSGKNTVICL